MSKLDNIKFLNDGNPVEIGTTEGSCFTVSPASAKRSKEYRSEEFVELTKFEEKMLGVVVCQNRGMVFSSKKEINGYDVPDISDINLIVVAEKSRKLKPVDDENNKILWLGKGDHEIKDVLADGQGQHWLVDNNGELASRLWLKLAMFGYGIKGMLMPGAMSDVGAKVIDYWGVERTITLGNTILLNSSLVKGIDAYDSLEDLIAHAEEWGLTHMMKQWQSGDHKPADKRVLGTQVQAGNLAYTNEEIVSLLRPEALEIWASQFPEVAWMKLANVKTTRGRAIAARPELINKDLIMDDIDEKAGNQFRRIAKGKVMVEGRYLKMFQDELAYSLSHIHGMSINDAAKKAAKTGVHGEIRVNPSFAGRYYEKDENGVLQVKFKKETHLDDKGRYIEVAIARYPHGAPSETIVVKLYLDNDIPDDVIVFPVPVANDDGTIPVKYLYALRLQGADFDGDAVTAYSEETFVKSQKRNIGMSYMIIPINTESTEKDKTMVTNETFEEFCHQKVASLSNRVGLIATSLKYFLSQDADLLRKGIEAEVNAYVIGNHSTAMGDDIDEFKHGKAKNTLIPFFVQRDGFDETLYSPYFNRYAMKYKSEEDFNKAVCMKDGSEKVPGSGVLDMYAVNTEKLMKKAGLEVVKEVKKASDGKNRYYFTVHPVKWKAKEVELHIADHGESNVATSLPKALEKIYGVEPGTAFTAKELFLMLYRDNAATLRKLQFGEDEDRDIKNMAKYNERFALAKIAIVAWTKAMKAKKGEIITAEEAMKIFSTLMVQHLKNNRSVIDTMTRPGSFARRDGTIYERTLESAKRCFTYFLDVCGDGLFLNGQVPPHFESVSDNIKKVAGVTEPDMEKAKKNALAEIKLIDKFVTKLEMMTFDEMEEEIDLTFYNEEDVDDEFLRTLSEESMSVSIYD